MTHPRFSLTSRHRFALLVALALATITLLTSPAGAFAAVSGQQGAAWGEFGVGQSQLFDPGFMGVDTTDGSVFIASYEETFQTTIIKKFSEEGNFEGEVSLPGLFWVGLAVDPTEERFYVLEDELTSGPQPHVASKILAFETQPTAGGQLAQVEELPVPVVGGPEAIFNPQELVFDPLTHDLVIRGENEAREPVLQRIITGGGGSVGAAWVQTGANFGGEQAIAIDESGLTYIMAEGSQDVVEAESLPPEFTSASTPTPLPKVAAAAEEVHDASDFQAVTTATGTSYGSQMAVTTASDGEDTLYWKAANRFSTQGGPGEILVIGYSLGAEAETVAFGGGPTEGSCTVETDWASLVAGRDGSVVTFDQGQEVLSTSELPAWFPLVSRFGPGGSGCPAPAAAIKLTGEGGTQITDGGSIAEGARVVLDGSESELNGNTPEGVGWKIEGPDGTTTEDRQKAAHVFTAPGTYKIRLGLKTLNLNLGLGSNFGATDTLVVTAGSGVTEFPLGVGTTGAGSAAVECDTGGGFGSCANDYPKGEEIVFRATPDSGSEVAMWGGCVESGNDECTVEDLDAATSVSVAVRGRSALHLSTSGTGNGSFLCAVGAATAAACAAEYEEGEMVTISPVAGAGSEFAGWGGACTGTGTCRVDIEGEESVSAMFNKVPTGNNNTTSTTSGNSTSAGSTGSTATTPPPPPGKQKTAAQIAKEKRTEALAKCKKMHGKAKTECVKKANLIGKPKPKSKKKH